MHFIFAHLNYSLHLPIKYVFIWNMKSFFPGQNNVIHYRKRTIVWLDMFFQLMSVECWLYMLNSPLKRPPWWETDNWKSLPQEGYTCTVYEGIACHNVDKKRGNHTQTMHTLRGQQSLRARRIPTRTPIHGRPVVWLSTLELVIANTLVPTARDWKCNHLDGKRRAVVQGRVNLGMSTTKTRKQIHAQTVDRRASWMWNQWGHLLTADKLSKSDAK